MGNFFKDVYDVAVSPIKAVGDLLGNGSKKDQPAPTASSVSDDLAPYVAAIKQLQPAPIDYDKQAAAAAAGAAKTTAAQAKAAQQLADANLKRYPQVASTALVSSITSATALDKYIQNQFQGILDDLVPGWREQIIQPAVTANQAVAATAKQYAEDVFPTLAGQMASRAESYLKGEIPDDVSAQIRQVAAEGSAAQGMFGQAAGGRVARDFGLTSLDLVNQGAQMANNMNAFYGSGIGIMQQPIASSSALTNLLAPYRAPTTDVASMFANMTGQITGVANVSPNSVLANGSQVYGQNLTAINQIAQYNSDMRWNASMSGVNLYADVQNMNAAAATGKAQARNGALGSIGQLGGQAAMMAFL